MPGNGKIGVATARAIGNRPQRNSAKRRLREAIRLNAASLNPVLDYVFVANRSSVLAPFTHLENAVCRAASEVERLWAAGSESS